MSSSSRLVPPPGRLPAWLPARASCVKTAWLSCPASLVVWGPLGGWHLPEGDDSPPCTRIHVVLLRVQDPNTNMFSLLIPPSFLGTLDPNWFPPGPCNDVSPGRISFTLRKNTVTSRASPSEEWGFRGEASWAQRLTGAVPQHAFSLVTYKAPLARGCHQPQLIHSPLESSFLFSLFPLFLLGIFPTSLASSPKVT